ncbi:hypothetical protein Glove_117g565 [Diversispora epigaea]|uniref:Peptidase A2 domain-containing protein n=1 Tax=Diversispora epigaea TaxID=1348612 RepID=A0A397J3R8_9GLOM|nr:hypothetical protein Glove_117g565 [Diversispora epigaea]
MSERTSLFGKKWFKKDKDKKDKKDKTKISGVENPYPPETDESKSKNKESETLTPDLVTGGKMPNIYAEIARLNFTTKGKSDLFSYFTLSDKAEARAEKALASYSTEIKSVTDDKMFEPNLATEFVEKLKLKDTSEKPVFGNFDPKDPDLESDKAEARAEKALAVCNNDEEKNAYLNSILTSFNKNFNLFEKSYSTEIKSVTDDKMFEPNLATEFVEKLKLKDTSEKPVFGNFDPKDPDLERFAQNLVLEQLKTFGPIKDKDIEKFYEFAGPEFTWPSTCPTSERRAIFDYITDPDPWFEKGEGKELATNTLAYRRHIEFGDFDPSRGSHVHLINGEIANYGSEISGEEYEKLKKQNLGMFYAPIVEEKPPIIRFSSVRSLTSKEWQVHMRIRNKADPTIQTIMANIEHDANRNFRLILDSGSTFTVIPHFIRRRLLNNTGWSSKGTNITSYGSGVRMYKISVPWEASLDWIELDELYSWQKNVPDDINCSLVGFDLLDNTYQIKIPGEPYIFVTDNNNINRLEQMYQQQQ